MDEPSPYQTEVSQKNKLYINIYIYVEYINRKMLLLNLFAGQEWSYTKMQRMDLWTNWGKEREDELRE